jgi:hypothetical protein
MSIRTNPERLRGSKPTTGRLGFRKVRGTPYMACDPYRPIRIAEKGDKVVSARRRQASAAGDSAP